MPTVRKVPWRDQSELSDLHRLIYADPEDVGARREALTVLKLYVYAHPSSHPVAVSVLASLLSSLLSASPASPRDHTTRLSLALALTRFVNSLVDPLQTGLHARPVALLAAELGIPGWLVELRHAATHDSLPSLKVLVEGAEEAVAYLEHSFFLPYLASASFASSSSSHFVSPAFQAHLDLLPPLLKQHKTLSKSHVRDRSSSGNALRSCRRSILAWLDRCDVFAGEGDGEGEGVRALVRCYVGPAQDDADQGDEALSLLVPVSKKKRPAFEPTSPYPPASLLPLHASILTLLSRARPGSFSRTLTVALARKALAPGAADVLSSWLVWSFNELCGDDEREEVLKEIGKVVWKSDRALEILDLIRGRHPNLQSKVDSLIALVRPSSAATSSGSEPQDADELSMMEARLAQLSRMLNGSASAAAAESDSEEDDGNMSVDDDEESNEALDGQHQDEGRLAPPGSGWVRLSEAEWGEGHPIGWRAAGGSVAVR